MYHILAALHHSGSSVPVYHTARDLAKTYGANLHLVHVLVPGEARETETDWIHTMARNARMDEHRVHSNVVAADSPEAGIAHEAERIDADLIVVGRTLDHPDTGDIASKLLRASRTSVWVVPIEAELLTPSVRPVIYGENS